MRVGGLQSAPGVPAAMAPEPAPPSVWVGVQSAPRATGAIAPKRAATERPDRRVETLAPTERLMRGRGTARVRTPVCVPPHAGSHAQAGRRAALDAQPERPLKARGAKDTPREWQERHTLRSGGARNNPRKGRQGPSGVQGPGRTTAVPQGPTARPWCASHYVVAVFSYTCWCL